jgi:hypothetical protein
VRKVVLLGAVAVAVAACGSTKTKRLDPAAFRTKADAVCRGAQADAAKIRAPKVDPTSPTISDAMLKTWAPPLGQLVKRYRREVSDLRALRPPADFDVLYKQALDGLDKALDRLDDAASAAARGDQKAVREAIFASDQLSHDANQIAFNYGLKVCGQ